MALDSLVTPAFPGAPSPATIGGAVNAVIRDDGRIKLPGMARALTMDDYLPMVHLYTAVQEAARILDRYRDQLSDAPSAMHCAPLTALEASPTMPGLLYKREDQTVTKAYKVRGAVVGMAKVLEAYPESGFLAVSTGNHALGVLKAAELLRPRSIRLVVPLNTGAGKLEMIQARIIELQAQGIDAALQRVGETFDEARAWAKTQNDGDYYLDPYGDPWVVAGQGTIGLELYRQLLDRMHERDANDPINEVTVLCPVGGGGLLAGTATALSLAAAWDPRFRGVRVNFVGLQLADLSAVYGDAIRVAQTASANGMLFSHLDVQIARITDTDMAKGMLNVHDDLGVWVEGPCGATKTVAERHPLAKPAQDRLVISVMSGGNVCKRPENAASLVALEVCSTGV